MFSEIGVYPSSTEEDKRWIDDIFGVGTSSSNDVRFINTIKTNIPNIEKMYVMDEYCNVFARQNMGDDERIVWYRFDASEPYLNRLLDKKQSSVNFSYVFISPTKDLTSKVFCPIEDVEKQGEDDWILRFANREFV
mgnify:CR=1 FL=1